MDWPLTSQDPLIPDIMVALARVQNQCARWDPLALLLAYPMISGNNLLLCLETRLSYRDTIDRCQNRASLNEVDLECLRTTRAIAGWCSAAR
jgi:hypothetical protein